MAIRTKNKITTSVLSYEEQDYARKVEFDDLESRPYNYDYEPTQTIEAGTVTSSLSNSITDSSKNWTENQFTDMVVRLVAPSLEEDYCIIASNTSNTLVFDCNKEGWNFQSFVILETFLVENMSSTISFDIRNYDCALILPLVETVDNRKELYVYNELANNGSHKLVVIARNVDRIRGNKFITLDHKYEGVMLASHYRGLEHWDLLFVENVKRYVSFGVDVPITISNNASYVNILASSSISTLAAKRFIERDIGGIKWYKYKSIVSNEFLCSGTLSINKTTGGFSVIDITIRVKRFSDGQTYDFDNERSVSRFSNGQILTIPIHIPFMIESNDEITIVAKNSDGDVLLDVGSVLTIREY
jgi:hypothetical protein